MVDRQDSFLLIIYVSLQRLTSSTEFPTTAFRGTKRSFRVSFPKLFECCHQPSRVVGEGYQRADDESRGLTDVNYPVCRCLHRFTERSRPLLGNRNKPLFTQLRWNLTYHSKTSEHYARPLKDAYTLMERYDSFYYSCWTRC